MDDKEHAGLLRNVQANKTAYGFYADSPIANALARAIELLDPAPVKRPTIAELEAILSDEAASRIEIQPDGSIRAVKEETTSAIIVDHVEARHCESVVREFCAGTVPEDFVALLMRERVAARYEGRAQTIYDESAYKMLREQHELACETLATLRAEHERLKAAAFEVSDAWALWTSQEMYGEHIREGMVASDFAAWQSAFDALNAELAKP